jgi:N-acetylneuraminic acid mutarotase
VTKIVTLLLVLVFLAASCLSVSKPAFSSASGVAENTWTQKAPMPTARGGLGVATVNGKIYAIGGSIQNVYNSPSSSWEIVGTNEEYDPATNTWTTKKPMPTPRLYFATAVYQDKICCFGGLIGLGQFPYQDTDILLTGHLWSNATEVYDPATDMWETQAPMPSTMQKQLAATVADGKIYFAGGYGTQPAMVYDPVTDSWNTTLANSSALLDTGDGQFASALVGNKIYAVSRSMWVPSSGALFIYDVSNESWSLGATAPSSISGGVAVVTSGLNAPERVYFVGPTANYAYDPVSDSWQLGVTIPTSRIDFGITVLNDELYVLGGYSFVSEAKGYVSGTAMNEQYTPLGYGTVSPLISLASPENQEYNKTAVPLIFTVNKPTLWLGYSLDGKDNATISGNTTITDLTNGLHNVTVYARDEFENTGASETISFSVEVPFPTVPVAVASVAVVAVVIAGLLVYFKKRKR